MKEQNLKVCDDLAKEDKHQRETNIIWISKHYNEPVFFTSNIHMTPVPYRDAERVGIRLKLKGYNSTIRYCLHMEKERKIKSTMLNKIEENWVK